MLNLQFEFIQNLWHLHNPLIHCLSFFTKIIYKLNISFVIKKKRKEKNLQTQVSSIVMLIRFLLSYVGRGMAYLHNEPNVIIHRDLKPR